MRPVRYTVSSATSGAVIPMDQYLGPFNVGIGVAVSAGASLTYTVEHTFDDVFSPTFSAASATWFPNSGLTDKTASADGNYAFTITAMRLRVSAWASGTATLNVLQSGAVG